MLKWLWHFDDQQVFYGFLIYSWFISNQVVSLMIALLSGWSGSNHFPLRTGICRYFGLTERSSRHLQLAIISHGSRSQWFAMHACVCCFDLFFLRKICSIRAWAHEDGGPSSWHWRKWTGLLGNLSDPQHDECKDPHLLISDSRKKNCIESRWHNSKLQL